MSRIRVVLDTNVLVSGITYPQSVPGKIVALWRNGELSVVLSNGILQETSRVLPTLKRNQLTREEIRDLVDSLIFLADIVEPAGEDPRLRDPADQHVLGAFLAAGADYLITGDKDLLALAPTYPVITPSEFWSRHG